MCKCVRDADRLDSLKPRYTVNDVSNNIVVKTSAVDLSCTRFKTRMRQSGSQVRIILHTSALYLANVSSWSDGNIRYDDSTSSSRQTKARSRGM